MVEHRQKVGNFEIMRMSFLFLLLKITWFLLTTRLTFSLSAFNYWNTIIVMHYHVFYFVYFIVKESGEDDTHFNVDAKCVLIVYGYSFITVSVDHFVISQPKYH